MKIYIPNVSNTKIGGGWSFLRNLIKGLGERVDFVDKWEDCDIVFVFGITTINKPELHVAVRAGKKLVLRVDNIPRKSRNKRQSPAERLTEFGGVADCVVYQSNWAKKYAGYFIKNDNEIVINNGVDTEIFNKNDRESDGNEYLYIDYNPNPNKRLDEAIYIFDMIWRKNNDAFLTLAGNMPKMYTENSEFNWDLPVPATVQYHGITDTPEETAELMKRCDYIIYPSFAEAYPNTLLEAIACGLKTIGICAEGGAVEVLHNSENGVKTIQEMANEYLNIFKQLTSKKL